MSLFSILWALLVVTTYSHTVDTLRVTRRLVGPDLFTNPDPKPRCHGMMGECYNAGCSLCICNESTPTFIAHQKKCVSDGDVRQLFKSLRNRWNIRLSCTPNGLPTINISGVGEQKLAVCKRRTGNEVNYGRISCDVARVKYLDENQDGSFGEEKQFVNDRQMFKLKFVKKNGKITPVFEWDPFETTHPFVGAILSINFNCTKGNKKRYAQFIVKISGERQRNFSTIVVPTTRFGPRWTSPVIQPTSVTTQSMNFDALPTATSQSTAITTHFTATTVTTSAVITTQSPATSTKEAQVIGGKEPKPRTGERKGANTVTIVLSVTGSLILVVAICLSVVLLMRRQRKSERNTAKEITGSDPTYPVFDKGVDRIMLNGELNVAYCTEEDSTYQPIEENTRATSDQPIYETLEIYKQSNPGEDPSIYQALDIDKLPECKQENHYQTLFKERRIDQELKNNENQEDNTEREGYYAVLEDPSEDIDDAEGPVYQVLEQGEENRSPQESTTASNEPIYDVLEAE